MTIPPPPTPVNPSQPPKKKDRSILLEDAAIILSIPVLWLFVLRLHQPVYVAIALAALAVLVWILVRRIRRINQASDRGRPTDDDQTLRL